MCYWGVRALLKLAPDWVLTGVNCGFNLGEDVLYSDTVVGAAFDGCLQGGSGGVFFYGPFGGDLAHV